MSGRRMLTHDSHCSRSRPDADTTTTRQGRHAASFIGPWTCCLVFIASIIAGCGSLDSADVSKAAAESIFQAGGKLRVKGNDRTLSQIDELPAEDYTINWIDLNNTPVTDDYLIFLEGMSSIEYIGLHSSRITDAGLDRLLNQKNLAEIELSYTGITDAGFLKLADLPSLKKLFIYDTGITDGALEEFRKKKPKCLVVTAR